MAHRPAGGYGVNVSGILRALAVAACLAATFAAPALAAPTWLAPVDLAGASDPGYPVVASDNAGETFVSWYDTVGANTRVLLASHAPGGAWSPASPISDLGASVARPDPTLVQGGHRRRTSW